MAIGISNEDCREYVAFLYMTCALNIVAGLPKGNCLIPYPCDAPSLDIISSVFSLKHLRCRPCAKVVCQFPEGSDCFGCLIPRVCPPPPPFLGKTSIDALSSSLFKATTCISCWLPVLNLTEDTMRLSESSVFSVTMYKIWYPGMCVCNL